MKKMFLMMVLVVASLGFLGCDNRVTPADVQALAAKTQAVAAQADDVQKMANDLTSQLSALGVTDSNTIARIAKINAEADKVQQQVKSVTASIQAVQTTGDEAQDWIAIARAANAASTPFNPYAPLVEGGLALATLFFGVLAKKKAADATTAQAKYEAHKAGVEKTMKEVSASDNKEVKAVESQLYHNIGEARKAVGAS